MGPGLPGLTVGLPWPLPQSAPFAALPCPGPTHRLASTSGLSPVCRVPQATQPRGPEIQHENRL